MLRELVLRALVLREPVLREPELRELVPVFAREEPVPLRALVPVFEREELVPLRELVPLFARDDPPLVRLFAEVPEPAELLFAALAELLRPELPRPELLPPALLRPELLPELDLPELDLPELDLPELELAFVPDRALPVDPRDELPPVDRLVVRAEPLLRDELVRARLPLSSPPPAASSPLSSLDISFLATLTAAGTATPSAAPATIVFFDTPSPSS